MFGSPVNPPKGATILQTIWSYIQKPDKKKSRNCCNGKQLKHQKHRTHKNPLHYYQSYSVCSRQVEMRFFCAICADRNYFIGYGDVENAYAQSPPPEEPTFVCIDDQYADWYLNKYGLQVNK